MGLVHGAVREAHRARLLLAEAHIGVHPDRHPVQHQIEVLEHRRRRSERRPHPGRTSTERKRAAGAPWLTRAI